MKATFDAQKAPRLYGMPTLVNELTRMLVVGSFPSVASLVRQQDYAHPQNAF